VSVRHIAVLAPVPPAASGVADHVAATIGHLATALGDECEVVVVTPDGSIPSGGRLGDGAGVRVIGQSEFAASRSTFAVTVHHIGNHPVFHRWIADELLQHGGIAVIHDLELSGLGIALGEVVEAADAAVVHDRSCVGALARLHPWTPIHPLPLTSAATWSPTDREALRAAQGWSPTEIVIGVLGGFAAHKRVDLAIDAFTAVCRRDPRLRLAVVGRSETETDVERVRQAIARSDGARVVVETDVPGGRFDEWRSAVDVLVDLRTPATGATSATITDAIAVGHPVVVTDLSAHAWYPRGPLRLDTPGPVVVRVPIDGLQALVRAGEAILDIADRIDEVRATANLRRDEFVDSPLGPRSSAAAFAEIVRNVAASSPQVRPTRARAVRMKADPGTRVTLVADLTATTGLAEVGRNLAAVLLDAGVTVDHFHHECLGAHHNPARDERGLHQVLRRRRDAPVEIWIPNINEFPYVERTVLRPPFSRRRYVIANWFWELPTLDAFYAAQVGRVDEIWVGSPFIARTFRALTDRPVVVVPPPVRATVPLDASRAAFGLSDADTIFLFDFDANSTAARKNPFALVEAFRAAFAEFAPGSARGGPRLVMKVGNARKPEHRLLVDDLTVALQAVGGVLLLDDLSRSEMNTLHWCADVYVSMHRSEGLGLGMLEAMYLGTPVVSPGHPEKWTFPLAATSSVVPAPPRRIVDDDHRYLDEGGHVYRTGRLWTEPSVSHMGRWMRLLFDDPSLRERLGRRQARLVREHYGPDIAARVMLERLAAIGA
jgi:glycosyltransferase involved in cell wall biosynthesis